MTTAVFNNRRKRPLFIQDYGSGVVSLRMKQDATAQATIPNGTNTDVLYVPNGSLQPDNKTWICPVSGNYMIIFEGEFAANATGIREFRVLRNNKILSRDVRTAVGVSGATTIRIATVTYLNAGDAIKTQAGQTSGGNLALTPDSAGDEFGTRFIVSPVCPLMINGV